MSREGGEGGGVRKRAAAAGDNLFLDVVSEHLWASRRGGRGRVLSALAEGA
jgi:hypothetical protein